MKVFEVDMPATLEVIFSQLKRNRMVWSLRALRGGERALPSLSKRPLPVVDWTALSVDTCKVDSTLAAVLTPIMFETGTVMSKTGEADDTISDEACVREASATTATRQALAQPELRRVLVAVPPSRRESAGGCGTMRRTPLWSFGGQSRKLANVGIHTKNAYDGSRPNLYAATRKADVSTKVSQSSLHWSRHTANISTTSCPRFYFVAMLHRLDCSVFCERCLECKHRFATVFLE